MPSTDFNIKPLSQDEVGDFFYGRRSELDFLLNQITKSKGGKAFAISGRRGSGKSTLINKLIKELKDKKENYLIVKVDVPKEFDEFFLLKRILRAVCEEAKEEANVNTVEKDKDLLIDVCVKLKRLDYQTTQINEVGKEKAVIKAVKGSVNAVIAKVGGDRSVEDSEIEKTIKEIQFLDYDLERVQAALKELLNKLKKVFEGGIVIIVDETDKSNYVDAIKTLDNVKPLFWLENCYYIFVGSEEFHEDYLSGIKTGKKTLLDSLFTRIVYLRPFGKEDLVKVLKLRIGKEVAEGKNEILETIATISKGNPRDAIRYCDLLVGECGSFENAKLEDLQRVIQYTFPHFPPGNLNHFIPISLFISELVSDTMDPIIESCAVSIVSYILEMKPKPEKKGRSEFFSCDKKVVGEAIVADSSKKYGFSMTEFETALAFLSELGLVTRDSEDKNLTLTILDHPRLLEHKKMFEHVMR
jgi:AAA+ ATPase superfamily predicted ATPase